MSGGQIIGFSHLHLSGAQKNPGGRADLIHYLGDPEKKPPTLGFFQNTLAAEGKLMFPAVPGGTVIDTRSRRMWLTEYPKIISLPDCRFTHIPIGIPPGASYFIYSWPLNGVYWHPPSSDQAKEVIKGWTGTSPNAWLTKETQAVAPGLPASRGFANLIALNGNGCADSPSILIKDGNHVRAMDLRNGAIRDHKMYEWDWLFMNRPLDADEQYYWYSNQ